MTLTSAEVLELVAAASTKSVRAATLVRRAQRQKKAGELPPGQVALLDAVEALQRKVRDRAPVPAHPEAEAERTRVGRHRREKGTELEAAELAWIQRLPLDPRQVSYEDAVQLAELAGSISAMKSPASARLVESVWLPVKEVYDLRVAEARLAQLPKSPPELPREVLSAVEDAISKQYPNLGEHAVLVEAQQAVRDFRAQHESAHRREHERAQELVDSAGEAIRARNATSREVAV